MKILLSLLLVALSNVSLSQSEKMESLLLDNTWLLTNDDIVKFNPMYVQGSDGYWEIKNDSMIVARHCYMQETNHKIVYISNDSLVLRVYNQIWESQKVLVKLEATETYYYFRIFNKSDEGNDNLRKHTLHLTNK